MEPSVPPSVVDRLVSIHAKLLQLAESIAEFQSQIQYGGAEGMMGWQDVLAKYSLLTSYTHSVFDLLITPPTLAKTVEKHKSDLGVDKPAYKTREEQRVLAQQESDAWKRTTAQVLVHPGKTVEQDRDWIVGVLMRTKQVPEVEKQEADLLSQVPPSTDASALYKLLQAHDKLADDALEACRRLKKGVEDREFNWKARAAGDDDDEDSNVQKVKADPPKHSTTDQSRFMSTGVLGR